MDLQGQTILITGASRGLGRAHAKYLTEQGAMVILSARDGSQELLAQVVDELRRGGGRAEFICADVRDGDSLGDELVSRFGVIQAVVHNAGAVADASFAKLTEQSWADVWEVNLMGAVRLTQALWPYFKKQKYGRIVFTTSSAGLYGNFGQANYSAVKMAINGLCKTLAIEGHRSGIGVNCIAPVGRTEMNAKVLPADLAKKFDPKAISPLVAYLCHRNCRESGSVFEVMGGWMSKVHFARGRGHHFPVDGFSLEDIHRHWSDVCSCEKLSYPASAVDSMQRAFEFS